MEKTFLITGAAGFIGSHLVDYLLSKNEKVVAIDNFCDFYDPQIKRDNIKEHLLDSQYKLYEGDLCDYDFLKAVFEENNITHVVHLAAMAGVRPSLQNPVLYQKVNNESTLNILDLMTKINSAQPDAVLPQEGVSNFLGKPKIEKFVFASSSSVYGSRSKVPFAETEDISKPISPYAATKVSGEAMCYTFSHLYKLPTVALRFFTVYGPRQRPDLAIHKFTKLIDQGKAIPVYGDGTAQRDFTYIDDIIDGIVKSIDYVKIKEDLKVPVSEDSDDRRQEKIKAFQEAEESNQNQYFEIFNLGESKTTTVTMLISQIESKLAKKAVIEYYPSQPGDVPITYADVTKPKKLLGYNPQTDIDEGIGKFVDWYLSTKKLASV